VEVCQQLAYLHPVTQQLSYRATVALSHSCSHKSTWFSRSIAPILTAIPPSSCLLLLPPPPASSSCYTALTVAMDYLADDSVMAHMYVACRSAFLLLPLSALLLLPLSAHVAHMCLISQQALLYFIFYFTPDVLEGTLLTHTCSI
jgi:hypothetical protein